MVLSTRAYNATRPCQAGGLQKRKCAIFFGRVMKAQKTATKTQVYFQQKRKCKINKTATCNFKSATSSVSVKHRIRTGFCKYRHLSTDCFIIKHHEVFFLVSADCNSSCKNNTCGFKCRLRQRISVFRMILDGRWDVFRSCTFATNSVVAEYGDMITLTKLAMLQLLRYEFPANVQLRSFQYAPYTSSQYIENTHVRFSCRNVREICCLYIQNNSFLY